MAKVLKAPVETPLGSYKQDESGVWHYRPNNSGDAQTAVEDAIKYRLRLPNEAVVHFWLNGLYCPMIPGDDTIKLWARYQEWSSSFRGSSALNTAERFAFPA